MRLDIYQAETARTADAIIGLRNRIVHDYMNINMDQVMALIADDKDQFVVRFLVTEFPQGKEA